MHSPSQGTGRSNLGYVPAPPDGSSESLRLLTLEEAAGMLCVPVSWLRHRVANRQVTCTRLGRHIRFTREQVDTIVAGGIQPIVEGPTAGLTRRARRPR